MFPYYFSLTSEMGHYAAKELFEFFSVESDFLCFIQWCIKQFEVFNYSAQLGRRLASTYFFENVLFAAQYAFLADASSGSLIDCPNQASLRLWIVSDQGSISHTLYSLLLVIHLVLTLWRKKSLLNESIFLVLEKTKKNVGEPRRYVCKVTKE